jgi:hypothetical protein
MAFLLEALTERRKGFAHGSGLQLQPCFLDQRASPNTFEHDYINVMLI